MTSTPGSWAQLRQQARQLESQTETLFHSYSQYTSTKDLPSQPSEDETRLESRINALLAERETLLSQLSRSLDSDAQSSALKTSHLSRHRELVVQHKQEYARLKRQISEARDRANLLSSVHADIAAYRASNPEQAEADYMLQERGRIDRSHDQMDSLLSRAYETNNTFIMQREQLESVRRRITNAVGMIPGVNSLVGRIGMKRRRDGIILGSFIAFCFLAFLYFL